MPANEIQYLSCEILAIEIRVTELILYCGDATSKHIPLAEAKKMSMEARDTGPDTYFKKLKVQSLLLRRPSLDLVNLWLNAK